MHLCAHAARCSVQDLQTTPWAWTTTVATSTTSVKTSEDTTTMNDQKNDDQQQQQPSSWTYVQHALIYHRQHVPTTRKAAQDDLDEWLEHWDDHQPHDGDDDDYDKPTKPLPPYLLGRISLYYVASKELTQDELKNFLVGEEDEEEDACEEDDEDDEDEDELGYEEDDEDNNAKNDGITKKKAKTSNDTESKSTFAAPPPEILAAPLWRRGGGGSSPLLYHAVVEYRSLPATGNPWAVQAEAWSMMTWGQGSPLDEELKFAALAGLSDPHAKYLLEIDSVRGKRYQFDWIPATSPPPLINLPDLDDDDEEDGGEDEFDHQSATWAQCLGVRVTDHEMTSSSSLSSTSWALTRMQFQLDPKSGPRDAFVTTGVFNMLHRVPNLLQRHFLQLNPRPPTHIRASPSGHALLLTPVKTHTDRQLGSVYWQGRFWKNWNNQGGDSIDDNMDDEVDDVWNHVPALFGMNFNAPFPLKGGGGGPTATMTTPLLQPPQGDSPKGRTSVTIVDMPSSSASPTTLLKQAYAVLWQELLIDARYGRWNLAGKLLNRLIYNVDGEDDEDIDDDDDDVGNSKSHGESHLDSANSVWPQTPPLSANVDCLESIVLQSNLFDPVGIAAKALATHFAKRYGAQAFPCLSYEVEWVQRELPQRKPIVVVPQRALNVLRRGGYFDVPKTKQELIEQQQALSVANQISTDLYEKVICLACNWLDQAESSTGYRILHQDKSWRELVVLVPIQSEQPFCQFDATMQAFQIRDDFFTVDWPTRLGQRIQLNDQDDGNVSTAAYVLGMLMAQVHPSGIDVLAQYMLQNTKLPKMLAAAAAK